MKFAVYILLILLPVNVHTASTGKWWCHSPTFLEDWAAQKDCQNSLELLSRFRIAYPKLLTRKGHLSNAPLTDFAVNHFKTGI